MSENPFQSDIDKLVEREKHRVGISPLTLLGLMGMNDYMDHHKITKVDNIKTTGWSQQEKKKRSKDLTKRKQNISKRKKRGY